MTGIKCILLIFGLLISGLVLAITVLSKEKYKLYIAPLKSKEYSMKPFLPYGLYVLDLFQYRYLRKYDRKILRKISFIYGLDYAVYYLKIHMASKIVYMTVLELLICFIGYFADAGPLFLLLLIVCPAAMFFLCDRLLDEKGEKRLNEMRRDFPDFVGKMTLLMGAGLNVRQTFEKIGSDTIKESPLYIEVKRTVSELQSGKSEIECYQTFAERVKVKEANRLAGIIIQNIRIGGAAMLRELNRLSDECWNLRKNNANRLAEQAQIKLTFPMMMMFIAVLLTIMVPAVLSMRGI